MKKTIQYTFLLLVSSFLCSCSEEPKDETPDWASIEVYDDYIFSSYESPMLTRILEVKTNEDAKHKISAPMRLALVDSEGNNVNSDRAQLYQDGQISGDNTITISPEDNDVEIGIMLNKSFAQSGEKTCYWTLKVVENPGYEMVCGCDLDELSALQNIFDGPEQSVKISVTHVANSVKVWTNLVLWIILAALVAWHVMSRIVNPSVRFTRVTIDYGDTEMKYDTRRCYKVILTNKPLKFGLFHRFFVGKVCVICNEFWDTQATLKMGYKDHLKVITKGDYDIPDEMKRKEDFVIKNEAGKKATLLTN